MEENLIATKRDLKILPFPEGSFSDDQVCVENMLCSVLISATGILQDNVGSTDPKLLVTGPDGTVTATRGVTEGVQPVAFVHDAVYTCLYSSPGDGC